MCGKREGTALARSFAGIRDYDPKVLPARPHRRRTSEEECTVSTVSTLESPARFSSLTKSSDLPRCPSSPTLPPFAAPPHDELHPRQISRHEPSSRPTGAPPSLQASFFRLSFPGRVDPRCQPLQRKPPCSRVLRTRTDQLPLLPPRPVPATHLFTSRFPIITILPHPLLLDSAAPASPHPLHITHYLPPPTPSRPRDTFPLPWLRRSNRLRPHGPPSLPPSRSLPSRHWRSCKRRTGRR